MVNWIIENYNVVVEATINLLDGAEDISKSISMFIFGDPKFYYSQELSDALHYLNIDQEKFDHFVNNNGFNRKQKIRCCWYIIEYHVVYMQHWPDSIIFNVVKKQVLNGK